VTRPPAPPIRPVPESGFLAPRAERGRLRQRIAVLIELLRDDSPVVLHQVRQALLESRRMARPALLRATESLDPLLRTRARALLLDQARERAWRRLLGYVRGERIDLERGLFLLAGFQTPGSDARPYRLALDRLGEELTKRIAPLTPGGARAQALGRYLGGELGFRGDREDYRHPANACITLLVERKRGLPLTLAALYRFVGTRAGLGVEILPVPGHVLTRVSDGKTRLIVDPFDSGRVLTEANCREYLAQHGLAWRAKYFEAASDGHLFLRQVGNLWRSARSSGWSREARSLEVLRRVVEERELEAAKTAR
jgi:regulator of sirC expression with transglutaminase-like and TPR domain